MPRRFDSETGRRRRDIGQKPKLWEAWLHPNDDDDGESESEKRKWGDIMVGGAMPYKAFSLTVVCALCLSQPVYAAYVNAPTPSPQGPIVSSAENPADPPPRPPRFIQPFTRKRSPPPSQPTASSMAGQALSLPSSPTATSTPAVRVAVLIAMPSQSQNHSGDESGLPVVEIGVVEADVKDHETEISNRDGS